MGTRLLYLSRSHIQQAGGASSNIYVQAIENALKLHAEGLFVQPLKPYLRTAESEGHIADRIIAMPAHLSGSEPISGIKWIGSKHDNPKERGLERASGLIVLNDPVSNYPIAVMEAGFISSMRTAAITVVAAKHLAKAGFERLTCIGCGYIAKAQLLSMLQHFDSVKDVFLYDVKKEAAHELALYLKELFPAVKMNIVETARAGVEAADVIITCTVTDKPYLPYEWIPKGAFVSNVSIMDVHKDVFLKADKVVVDDWDQCNREKKIINQLVLEGTFSREQLHAELGEIVSGKIAGRENDQEIIVLNPMGMAIEDVACAQYVYEAARRKGLGVWLDMYR
ncbi:2,3-diaminopropionate biosynthesis protein SbnB [Paenibacillus sp. L3-i20]|uniref:2,3-diaminopropionate biosynthesis protein SbnB n=1 Tax=Paenibacillus sp. L3-i20 TaxID=2905833 RepID=UPI001EDD128E|nr:2,3-diaminopropionate biosynthesis protein SbnB [Paenibacillus sp. L3-i20]